MKRTLVDPTHPSLSLRRQCSLLSLARSSFYYSPAQTSEEDLVLMRLLDEEYTRHPFYGSRKMTTYLHDQGYLVNRKRSSD
jgi:putative transposase|tara:strand:+ start:604 stop:846 length:243 start_codon:yes stop_codon:yes gene_type:complete